MAADRAVWRDRHRDHEAVWRLHVPRVRRRADVSEPAAASDRAPYLLVLRRRRDRGAALAYLCGLDGASRSRRLRHALRARAPAMVSAVQPARAGRGRASAGVQHLGELRHQHELAVLRTRDHDGLPRPDGGAHGPQFRLGRCRHSTGDRFDPRLRPARGERSWQFLGRYHPLHALHPAADFSGRKPVPRLARRAAEPGCLCRYFGGGQADDRPGTGRLAGGDQGSRHQRRRLLQCELRPSLREPDSPHQPRSDAVADRDRRGADQRARPHGERRAPGLGDLCRDGYPALYRCDDRLLVRIARQSCLRRVQRRFHVERSAGGGQHGRQGGRFGITPSALFATVTTDAGGAVDAMHDSFLPLGGTVLIVNMALGEVTFGGVGSGLYGMLAFAIVTMFVAGLMVGRMPEYLGKKLEAREVKMTMLSLLSYSLSILGCTALAAAIPQGVAGIANAGPHGFSEILYAFASATGNKGSSFAGLSTNTLFYNMILAVAMAVGRFIYVIPLLAVAGSLAQKKRLAPSAGSVPTHSPQFVGLLAGVVLIMGGVAYFPAVSLGPITECRNRRNWLASAVWQEVRSAARWFFHDLIWFS